ncbi:MAG: TolC family protein [Dissulfurimicrobium sp.]|uniref:TolC family protein n=1 Tax=Dissulfurimicrobium sp. TaxID=2022436 RepID=UPI0040493B2B
MPFVFIVALLIFPASNVSGATSDENDTGKAVILTLKNCMDIAIKRHPDIALGMSNIKAKESMVGQAKSGYFPQINLTTEYSRYSPVNKLTDRSFDNYSGGLLLQQNLYDFGKTSTQIKISSLNLSSSKFDLKWTQNQVIFNVKQAYFGVLRAKRNLKVAQDTVNQFDLHLRQAEGFYKVGIRPKFDVTKAHVDLNNARLNLIKAQNAMKLAMAALNNAMGVPDLEGYELEDILDFSPVKIDFNEALEKAYSARPDLNSILAQKKAIETSIDLAKKGYYPSISGNASYNLDGAAFPLADGWTAGISVTFPIFSGFLTRYQVEEARANLSSISAKEESLKNEICLDVKQAYLNLIEAEKRVPVAALGVTQAQENLDLAIGRYRAGVGNPVEVTDSEIALENAKLAHIQALYDYKVAFAALQRAIGE